MHRHRTTVALLCLHVCSMQNDCRRITSRPWANRPGAAASARGLASRVAAHRLARARLTLRCASSSCATRRMTRARGSKLLYTRCPKPIRRKGSFLSLARASAAGMLSLLPISSSMCSTASARTPGPRSLGGARLPACCMPHSAQALEVYDTVSHTQCCSGHGMDDTSAAALQLTQARPHPASAAVCRVLWVLSLVGGRRAVCAAVRRPPERGDAGRDACKGVGVAGACAGALPLSWPDTRPARPSSSAGHSARLATHQPVTQATK